MMTRLLPCFTVAVATAASDDTRVTMDDEPAFFAAALAARRRRRRAGAPRRRLAAVARPRGGGDGCDVGRRGRFAFSWAVSPARALSESRSCTWPARRAAGRPHVGGGGDVRLLQERVGARSPVHALYPDPAEFDYAGPARVCTLCVERASAGPRHVRVALLRRGSMRDLIAGPPGASTRATRRSRPDERLMLGARRATASSTPRAGERAERRSAARALLRARALPHVNITDVALGARRVDAARRRASPSAGALRGALSGGEWAGRRASAAGGEATRSG